MEGEQETEAVKHSMWTEKYRPKSFAEVKGQIDIIAKIKAFIAARNMPHMMFAGPAGVGKSTTALVIARDMFGANWRENFLELNASDERGIDVVRTKVKDFARTRAIGDVPFKIIFLDECDALTKEAQQALRRTMENYTQTTRFVLSCVTLDTKILLPEEREIMAKDFVDQYEHNPKHIHVQNISSDRNSTKNDVVVATVKLPASSIGKKVLEITTMTGRKLKLTDDHKLLTTNGWKEAGKLSKKDSLLIYPHLQGTPVEDNKRKIIDFYKFIDFVSRTEEEDSLDNLREATTFSRLKSGEKEKVLKRICELKELIKENKGVTERESELYYLIKQNYCISRKDLQEKMNITRMGINYLLPSLEKKGHIKRIMGKKTHLFIANASEPLILRNDMHIKKIIEKEFHLKISYSAVKRAEERNIERGRVDRVLGELKRRELLDITYNDIKKVGALARISGFMLGDGHLVRNSIRLHFAGNGEALREVQKDLEVLEYYHYSKIQSVKVKSEIGGRIVEGTTTSFRLDSKALSLLLQYLGMPKGDKTITSYFVPEFVMRGTRYVKREFLRALFGCDADKPKYRKMSFEALALRQNKASDLGKEMLQYYDQLTYLLETFSIASYVNIRDKGEVRQKDNTKVLTFELVVRPNNENLFKFYSKVGYAYEKYKDNLARLSAEYLRHKRNIIQEWQNKSQVVIAAVENGSSLTETAQKFNVTRDFISNQIKGKEVHLPKNKFMNVDEWKKKYKFNDLLFVNEISDIKEIDEEIVMDITCQDDHNFITNGLISHNCNYSSKIIDPIQSRCTVFRFRPLEKEQMFAIFDKIAKTEGIELDASGKEALHVCSEGDCRKAENILQSCAAVAKKITEDEIFSLASVAKPKEINEFLKLALENKFIASREKMLETMLRYGLSGLDLIKQIQREVWHLSVTDAQKVALVDKCGEIEFRMTEGSDEFVQLEALLAQFTLCKK